MIEGAERQEAENDIGGGAHRGRSINRAVAASDDQRPGTGIARRLSELLGPGLQRVALDHDDARLDASLRKTLADLSGEGVGASLLNRTGAGVDQYEEGVHLCRHRL